MEKGGRSINKALISLACIVFLIGLSEDVSATSINATTETKVDPTILEQLNRSEEVPVIIMLKKDRFSSLQEKKGKIKTKQSKVLSTLSRQEFKLKHRYSTVYGLAGRVTESGLNKLQNNPNVLKIYSDRKVYATLSESVPLINADDVQTRGYTGAGETVCVIDTGIDYFHSDLGGCFGAGCKVLGGYDYVNTDADPMDDNGHGTHVAGIVASENTTYKGVAPDADLVALKVLDASGGGYFSDIAAAVDWCVDNKSVYNISVITMSLGEGGEYNDPAAQCDGDLTANAIDTVVGQGIFVSIASGNEGYTDGISYPACVTNATSVGAVYDTNVGSKTWCVKRNIIGICTKTCTDATTNADKIVCFTNRDEILDLLAPGSVITSTAVGGGFTDKSGTSMAAPHVAGAAAVLLETDPTLTPAQIRAILKSTGVGIYDSGTGLTLPRIDVLAAIQTLLTWESYSDSAHTIPSDSFSGGTVYMFGQGWSSPYDIAYYDGDNDWVSTTDDKATVDGNLSDSKPLSTGSTGTWHSVVYPGSGATIPSTYNASDDDLLAIDEFEVLALPEFMYAVIPLMISGIVYLWMRRRFKN